MRAANKRSEKQRSGRGYWRRRRLGGIAALFALLLPVLLGVLALGVELGLWYLRQRDMQNAADAAVLAASLNNSATFATEGAQVAARYGYGGTAVSILNNQVCPPSAGPDAGTATCYRATVRGAVALFMVPLLGISGSTVPDPCLFQDCGGTAPTGPAVVLSATAMATRTEVHAYCILALSATGTGLDGRGSPSANLAGCDVMSNGNARCAGHNLLADHGDAVGTNDGCGVVQRTGVPAVPDPYAVLQSNIPAGGCAGYPQIPTGKGGTPLPAANLWTGAQSWTGNRIVCGDLQLTGDVDISGTADATLVIVNGQLDLNGHALRSGPSTGVTIVFTGGNSGGYLHMPTGDGTLDITAPTVGAWKGIAIYQDPGLTQGVDISAAGNSPNWNITGVVYLPKADISFNGAVSKATNGQACFGLVVSTIDVRGTAAIYPRGDCVAAQVKLPRNVFRGKLVQ